MDILKFYKNIKKTFLRFTKRLKRWENSQTSEVVTPIISSPAIPVNTRTERHIKSGYALFITHENYNDHRLTTRRGTLKDEEQLKILFIKFGFTVKSLVDPTQDDIFEEVKKTAALDSSQHDCILVVVNTHGHAGGILYAKDKAYSVDDICKPFLDNDEKLQYIPKIFIIQACRGNTNDTGKKLRVEEDIKNNETTEFHSVSSRFTNNAMESDAKASNTSNMVTNVWSLSKPNFLLAFSCVPDHMSWRHPTEGSLYVQQLCQVLSQSKRDVAAQLTQVHRQLMTMEIEDTKTKEKYKQACPYTSTLTYKIFFHEQLKKSHILT